MNYHRYDN